jgi:anti-sigma regulatory factor (Ser/Thr protein kinase)
MPPTFQRSFSRNVSEYLAVAGELEKFCAEQGLPDEAMFKVRLIVEELVLNLIDHATGSATNCIDLSVHVEPGQIVVLLQDDGNPFDPRSAPPFDKTKPLQERGPRGMGVHLVRSMTEEMTYDRVGSRNRLRVTVKRGS